MNDLERRAVRAFALIAKHPQQERMHELLPERGQPMPSSQRDVNRMAALVYRPRPMRDAPVRTRLWPAPLAAVGAALLKIPAGPQTR
ncbi:MAG TPA: hypothetical protein VM925_04215 [Labilithrix sp.]|nr:hypothetical protein [Labilithrix sp.]